MQIEKLRLHSDDLEECLLPRLLGTVFHVTSQAGFRGIQHSGGIDANQDLRFGNNWPSQKEPYFRSRGYISLFDLRNVERENEELDKFPILNPPFTDCKPVFLILDRCVYCNLMGWNQVQVDLELGEVVIPHIEAGIKGRISLESIRLALLVEVEESPFAQMCRRVCGERNE
jgi:hypothetical protein